MRTVRWWPLGQEVDAAMTFTGERFTVDQVGEIRVEHLHRYLWADRLRGEGKWIDAASGSGYGTYLLAKGARSVTGFDIDPVATECARDLFSDGDARFQTASVSSLGVDSGTVDVVVSFETIEHVDDPESAVAEFARCLSDDGVLVISSPNKSTYSSNRPPHNTFHKFEFYLDEFKEHLTRYFDNIAVYGQWTFGASSVIARLDAKPVWQEGSFWLNGKSEGVSLDATFEPRYFLAVASKSTLPILPAPSIAVDTFDIEETHGEVDRLTRELIDLTGLLERERVKALSDIEAVRRDVSDLLRLNQHLEEKLMLVKRELGRFVPEK